MSALLICLRTDNRKKHNIVNCHKRSVKDKLSLTMPNRPFIGFLINSKFLGCLFCGIDTVSVIDLVTN